ncbi:class I SAM-dependent methyltransferase [Candidatus Woesearchaeota archaeon]|nr:class I SAM-dependent methyltransferase [Candidatus Woesearchaeota archaeon]
MEKNKIFCRLCGSNDCRLILAINKKPEKETDFKIKNYRRQIFFCNNCGVYFNSSNFDSSSIYSGYYNDATYQNRILERYNKIMGLPYDKSDNKGRVSRIVGFLKNKSLDPRGISALDVGSGLCVFLGEMKKHGFKCFCIDPDKSSISHAIENVGVDGAYCCSLNDFKTEHKFGLITFNKVLEHVEDPISMLKKAKDYLTPDGFVYIELPDAETAVKFGGALEREEFYVEHNFILTRKSFSFILEKSGFDGEVRSIHEPSGKYTLFSFAAASDKK